VTGKAELTLREPRLLPSLEALDRLRPRAVLLCTKTPALRTLLPRLAAALTEAPALVVGMQNGIGVEDELSRHFPAERVARGIVNFAGTIDASSGLTVLHWITPPSTLCPLSEAGRPAAEELAALLSRAGLEVVATSAAETRGRVFFKAVLNSALNALCASTGLTMRQAMGLSHTRRLAELLLREGLSVAAACGHHYGENALEDCIRYLDEGGDHLPSMWSDLERGLMTEIEHVNGKLVKLGLSFKNVDVAVNHYFTAVVIAREIASGARQPDDIPDYLRRS
jgi:2-dehydropantoate 2-reductase